MNKMFNIIVLIIAVASLVVAGTVYVKLDSQIKDLKNAISSYETIIIEKDNIISQKDSEISILLNEIRELKDKEKTVVAKVETEQIKPQILQNEIGRRVEKVSVVVFFDFSSAVVKDSYKEELAKIAEMIKRKPTALVIEGHTDPQGDYNFNVWLSGERANSVKKAVLELADGAQPCNIISVGVGSSKQPPQALTNREKRRVVITALEDCKGL